MTSFITVRRKKENQGNLISLVKSYFNRCAVFSKSVTRGQSSRMPNCCTASERMMGHFPSIQRWRSSCEDNGCMSSKSFCWKSLVQQDQLTFKCISMTTHIPVWLTGLDSNLLSHIQNLSLFKLSKVSSLLWETWSVVVSPQSHWGQDVHPAAERGARCCISALLSRLPVDWLAPAERGGRESASGAGAVSCIAGAWHHSAWWGEPSFELWCAILEMSRPTLAAISRWQPGTRKLKHRHFISSFRKIPLIPKLVPMLLFLSLCLSHHQWQRSMIFLTVDYSISSA